MPIHRQLICLLLLLSLGLSSGCTKKPPQERAVDSAARRYNRVGSGMPKQEVVALLGQPAKREGNLYRWEIIANPQSSASIDVQFDTADKVAKIAKSHTKRD
jgi:hypothetical protein